MPAFHFSGTAAGEGQFRPRPAPGAREGTFWVPVMDGGQFGQVNLTVKFPLGAVPRFFKVKFRILF